MRQLLLGISLGALLVSTAQAADMAVKAPPISNLYPTSRCGLYYGAALEGGAGAVNGAPAGTIQIGGDVGGLIGYACPTAGVPWFAQFKVEFQNLNAGNAGFSLSGPVRLNELAAIQTPLVGMINGWFSIGQSSIPQITPLLPPGVSVVGTPQNYIGVVVSEDDISSNFALGSNREWLVSYGVRTGLLYNLVSGTNKTPLVGDTFIEYDAQSSGMCVGATKVTCPKLGNRWMAGLELKM